MHIDQAQCSMYQAGDKREAQLSSDRQVYTVMHTRAGGPPNVSSGFLGRVKLPAGKMT